MDERYITIAVEEYKALIEFQLRKQIEAEYEDELQDLKLQNQALENERGYWERMYRKTKDELDVANDEIDHFLKEKEERRVQS